MVEHECKRCKRVFNKKSTYDSHLNKKNKCPIIKRETNNKIIELTKENEKLKIEKDKDKYEELKGENSILIEKNIILNTIITNLQTEQKNIIKRLNIIENLIVKNTGINIDDENIDNELQTGGAIEGLQFENKLFKELKKYDLTIYFDKEITKKYGKSCAGIDIVIKRNNKLIILQSKREIKSGSLKDVNHFIRGSQIIQKEEKIDPILYWISKIIPNKSALESLKLDNVNLIIDINSKNALKKCIDNIKKDLNIEDTKIKNK